MHFWALCLFYEPFVMGGDVWQKRRYQVVAEASDPIEGYETFAWSNQEGEWRVHEKSTGGLLGEGETLHEAWAEAKKNIKETPDFAKQVKQLGPVLNHTAVEYSEAMRRIKRQKEKEAAESKARRKV